MDPKKIRNILPLIILAVAISCTSLFAQEDISTLEGLKGIYVETPDLDSPMRQKGLNAGRLKTDIEKQLKGAGIPVLSSKDYDRLKRSPRYPLALLESEISVAEIPNVNLQLYSIKVRLSQFAFLARKPTIKIWSTTWERRKILGAAGPEFVKEKLTGAVDEFVNDFHSVAK